MSIYVLRACVFLPLHIKPALRFQISFITILLVQKTCGRRHNNFWWQVYSSDCRIQIAFLLSMPVCCTEEQNKFPLKEKIVYLSIHVACQHFVQDKQFRSTVRSDILSMVQGINYRVGLSSGCLFSGVPVAQEDSMAVQHVQPLPYQQVQGKASFLLEVLQAYSASCSSVVLSCAAHLSCDTHVQLLCDPHDRGELVLFHTAGIFPWRPLNIDELLSPCSIQFLHLFLEVLCCSQTVLGFTSIEKRVGITSHTLEVVLSSVVVVQCLPFQQWFKRAVCDSP